MWLPTRVIHNKWRRKLHRCKWSGRAECSMSPPVISCLFLCRCCLTIRTSVGGGEHNITILYNTKRPCSVPKPEPRGVRLSKTWCSGHGMSALMTTMKHSPCIAGGGQKSETGRWKLRTTNSSVPEPLPAYKFKQLTALDKVSNSSGQNLLFADRFTDILSVFTFIHIIN